MPPAGCAKVSEGLHPQACLQVFAHLVNVGPAGGLAPASKASPAFPFHTWESHVLLHPGLRSYPFLAQVGLAHSLALRTANQALGLAHL